MKYYKISKLLNDSVSKFVIRKWIEVIDSSDVQYFLNQNEKA